jgi:prevent-host-death family protein
MSMAVTTFSSREFNQRVNDAKKAAHSGPVFITDRGRPAHVLLSIEAYRRLIGDQTTLADALGQHDVPGFDFEAPRAEGFYRAPDVS